MRLCNNILCSYGLTLGERGELSLLFIVVFLDDLVDGHEPLVADHGSARAELKSLALRASGKLHCGRGELGICHLRSQGPAPNQVIKS